MSKKIYVTRPIPEEGINLLKEKGFQVDVNPENKVLSKEELKKVFAEYEAVLTLLTDKVDEDVLSAAGQNLKIVANYAVGYDNIDVKAATKKKIMVPKIVIIIFWAGVFSEKDSKNLSIIT